jgi:hypothetical protein
MIITKYCIKIREVVSAVLFLAVILNLNNFAINAGNDSYPGKSQDLQYAVLSSAGAVTPFNIKTENKSLTDFSSVFSLLSNNDEISEIKLKSYSSYLCRKFDNKQKLYPFLSVYFSTGT